MLKLIKPTVPDCPRSDLPIPQEATKLAYGLLFQELSETGCTPPFNTQLIAWKPTYYSALSLSWYSRDLLKHSCTPLSVHSRRITCANSGVISPSSDAPARENNFRASSWNDIYHTGYRLFSTTPVFFSGYACQFQTPFSHSHESFLALQVQFLSPFWKCQGKRYSHSHCPSQKPRGGWECANPQWHFFAFPMKVEMVGDIYRLAYPTKWTAFELMRRNLLEAHSSLSIKHGHKMEAFGLKSNKRCLITVDQSFVVSTCARRTRKAALYKFGKPSEWFKAFKGKRIDTLFPTNLSIYSSFCSKLDSWQSKRYRTK